MNFDRKKIFLIIPVLLVIFSVVVMLLWNAILSEVLGVDEINFWQAAGLLALCRILFGGLGLHGGGLARTMHREMHNRWHSMSPDERRELLKRRGFGRHEHMHESLCEQRGEHRNAQNRRSPRYERDAHGSETEPKKDS